MKTLFQKTSVQITTVCYYAVYDMSLAMTPPEQGRRCATLTGMLLRIMSIEQLLPSGRWRCFGCVLSVAQYRYPDRRPAIPVRRE